MKIGDKVRVIGRLPEEYTAVKVGDITTYRGEDGSYNNKPTCYIDEGWIYTENIELLENPKKEGGEENMTHEFHIGDKVLLGIGACFKGEYVVTEINESTGTPVVRKLDKSNFCVCINSWELISCVKETMANLANLTKEQELAFSKEQKALFRVGITDGYGTVNSTTALNALVRANYKTLVAQAEDDIEEAEAEAEKIKKV